MHSNAVDKSSNFQEEDEAWRRKLREEEEAWHRDRERILQSWSMARRARLNDVKKAGVRYSLDCTHPDCENKYYTGLLSWENK